jgi:hypothetical protein
MAYMPAPLQHRTVSIRREHSVPGGRTLAIAQGKLHLRDKRRFGQDTRLPEFDIILLIDPAARIARVTEFRQFIVTVNELILALTEKRICREGCMGLQRFTDMVSAHWRTRQ